MSSRSLAASLLILASLPRLALAATEATPAGAPAPSSSNPSRSRVALTLSQAQDRALRNQPSLRQARGQTEAAAGRTDQARSGYLPQAGFTGSYQRTTGNFAVRPGALPGTTTTTATTTSGWSTNTYNFMNFGLNASQLIYDFGQTDGRWRAAAANRDATQIAEITAEQQALLAVRRAYFLVRADEDLIAVAQETLSNQDKHLGQIQAFVQAGIRPDIDLAAARTAVANARVQLVTATNDNLVARAQLNQAMGIFENVDYELADSSLPQVAGEEGSLDPLIDSALSTRPELETIRRQRRAQELTISALRGAYGPSLGAAAGATEAGQDFGHLIPNWFLGLTLNWSFLQGGLTKGQIREAQGTLATLAAQEDTIRLGVRVDVEQGQLAVSGAKATIAAAQEALVNAREQLRLAEARYANGLGSVIELSDAQVAYSTAAAQDVQARFNLSSARAQLMAALGVR
jgi:outer membrane protein